MCSLPRDSSSQVAGEDILFVVGSLVSSHWGWEQLVNGTHMSYHDGLMRRIMIEYVRL